jgi:hypothetical protein
MDHMQAQDKNSQVSREAVGVLLEPSLGFGHGLLRGCFQDIAR